MKSIEKRLERLEHQNQRLRRGMIGMLAAGLSLLVMGQTLPPKVHDLVRAKKFEIVGDGGWKMVTIGADRDSGIIAVRNKKGYGVVVITTNNGGDGLIMANSLKGKQGVSITSDVDGNGKVGIYSPKGKLLVSISRTKGGNGAVETFSAKGKRLVSIGATVNGNGIVRTRDPTGIRLIEIGADKNGQGRVVQFNRANKPKHSWPSR